MKLLKILTQNFNSFFSGKKLLLKVEALLGFHIEHELFITELEVLAFFNHHVTFPFLNCPENSNQNDLLDIQPTLYHDLINISIDTLTKYKLTMQQPD